MVQGGGKITYNVIKTRLGDLLYKLRCARQGVFQAGVVLLHKLRCGTSSDGNGGRRCAVSRWLSTATHHLLLYKLPQDAGQPWDAARAGRAPLPHTAVLPPTCQLLATPPNI